MYQFSEKYPELKVIISRIQESKFDEICELNDPIIYENPLKSYTAISALLAHYRQELDDNRSEFPLPSLLEKVKQVGLSVNLVNNKLKEHVGKLRRNDSVKPNSMLEFDSAKIKADKLAELLKAKIIWTNCYEELQLLEPSEQEFRFQKLLSLQQSFEILREFLKDTERISNFEKQKEVFLVQFKNATFSAIDSNDSKELDSLREKFSSLGKLDVFGSCFASYAKNVIKTFIENMSGENALRNILREMFSIWKRCCKLSDLYTEVGRSEIISRSLFDGILSKWDRINKIVRETTLDSDSSFSNAREFGKICHDFGNLLKEQGDEYIVNVGDELCQKLFVSIGDDYRKHSTSTILCVVNKITPPQKGSKHRYDWLLPFFEEIHLCMRDMILDASSIFGANFSSYIVSSLEQGLRELHCLLVNQDILNTKPLSFDTLSNKAVSGNSDDKISAFCVMGFLLNMADGLNEYIMEIFSQYSSFGNSSVEKPDLIANRHIMENLNTKVVDSKVESISNALIIPMEEEMQSLKKSALASVFGSLPSAQDELKFSLPTFSVPPHNYITTVGHGLLNQMNTIGSFGSDPNFIQSIVSIMNKRGGFTGDEEPELWLLSEIGRQVQNSFCKNVGNVLLLNKEVIHQFSADAVFLMEALVDLRLQPTQQLNVLSEKLQVGVAAPSSNSA